MTTVTPCRPAPSGCSQDRLKTKGDRAVSIVAPKLWNSLPPHIREPQSLEPFQSMLKTYLFTLAFGTG